MREVVGERTKKTVNTVEIRPTRKEILKEKFTCCPSDALCLLFDRN